jgi:hypothetical protein
MLVDLGLERMRKPPRNDLVRKPTQDDDPYELWPLMAEAGILTKAELARRTGVHKNRVNALFNFTPTGQYPKGYALDTVKEFLRAEVDRKASAARGEHGVPLALPGGQSRHHASIRGGAPVFPIVADDAGGGFKLVETPLRYVRVPEVVENVAGVVGVILRDPDMTPMYRTGDTLILNPSGAPQVGTGVAVMAVDTLHIEIREFVDEDVDTWTLRRYGRTPDIEMVSKKKFPRILTVVAVYSGR